MENLKDKEKRNIQLLILSIQKFLEEYECTEIDQAYLEVLQEVGREKIKDFDDEEFIEWIMNIKEI